MVFSRYEHNPDVVKHQDFLYVAVIVKIIMVKNREEEKKEDNVIVIEK